MKKQILFIGNSYTYFHDMPEVLFAQAAADAGYDWSISSVTEGGWRLSQFADPQDAHGQRLRAAVAGKQFDCVVLQDQSTNAIEHPEDFIGGIAGLQALLQDQTQHFVLYATWGRKPGSPDLERLGLTNAQMTQQLADAYQQAAERFDMGIAHVGRAFATYAAAHPDAELYMEDLTHPSLLGSTIAAQTILAAIAEQIL